MYARRGLKPREQVLLCSRPRGLSGAGDNLNPVGRNDLSTILHLERDILELESPDFIAETVGIEASL